MPHLTPDEIERFAETRDAAAQGGARSTHLATCARCREEVDELRALLVRLAGLEPCPPSMGFADSVMKQVELPPASVDLELARLPRWSPSLGFVTAVMARVRLPVPWSVRLSRFARRRRVALAGVAATTIAVSGGSAVWLFGAKGVAPGQLLALVAGGARSVLVDALLAAGRLGYRFGLVDAGGSIIDQISPTTALGSLGLASAMGLLSLWVMTRLSQAPPQPVALRKAA